MGLKTFVLFFGDRNSRSIWNSYMPSIVRPFSKNLAGHGQGLLRGQIQDAFVSPITSPAKLNRSFRFADLTIGLRPVPIRVLTVLFANSERTNFYQSSEDTISTSTPMSEFLNPSSNRALTGFIITGKVMKNDADIRQNQ